MKRKNIVIASVAAVALVVIVAIQRSPSAPPLGEIEVADIQGRITTNSDGTINAEITSVGRTTTRIKDGDYQVSYVTGKYSQQKGPHFEFGLEDPATDADWSQLRPEQFTFKDKTFFADGYKVRVSKNGTHIEVIDDNRRGPDYKGPFLRRPDWAQPAESKPVAAK